MLALLGAETKALCAKDFDAFAGCSVPKAHVCGAVAGGCAADMKRA